MEALARSTDLEIGVGDDGGRLSEIAHFLEAAHNFGAGDAAELIHQLDGGAHSIVGDAVADQHVELVLVVLDSQDHGHRLADLDDAAHFRGPRTFAHLRKKWDESNKQPKKNESNSFSMARIDGATYLNLHPALEVVAEEVGRHGVDHVDGEGSEGDGFLVVVVPGAAEPTGLVPHFLH